MSKFNYKNRNLISGIHLLGTLLLLAGLFAWASPLFLSSSRSLTTVYGVGTGSCLIGLLILFTYSGTAIDFTEKRFQEYISIMGFKLGTWQELPPINMVKVVSRTTLRKNTPNGISPTLSGNVTDHSILLYTDSSQAVFSFSYSNQSKATQQARYLADGVNSELILASAAP